MLANLSAVLLYAELPSITYPNTCDFSWFSYDLEPDATTPNQNICFRFGKWSLKKDFQQTIALPPVGFSSVPKWTWLPAKGGQVAPSGPQVSTGDGKRLALGVVF